ncbi:MAG: hypothetical protein K2X68_04875 [Novosphingobium sp.]|nr:hypothetical protein [Novosphingobium sp.]
MLHFAPRYGMISPCLFWGLSAAPRRPRAARLPCPANDNGAALAARKASANDTEAHDEALLAAALRLFAAHGLSAAQRACEAAEIAAAGGDSARAEWWIGVCAMLDGPLARACAARAIPQR